MKDIARIDYELLEQERAVEIQQDLTKRLIKSSESKERIDSLHRLITTYVANNQYDTAKNEMNRYFKIKKAYPTMEQRSERYREHCINLINAIESKRTFPGLATLSLAKRQELFDKVINHFEELKVYLKQIDMVDKDILIEDMRSTVWVVKAVIHSVFFIMLLAFLIDVTTGLGQSFYIVLNAALEDLTSTVFRYFNW